MFRNSYVVDLAAQIAIAEKDWETAQRYISDLEHISAEEDFCYRRATFHAARKHFVEALEDADVACASIPRRFEAMAQRADILIELDKFSEATSAIDELIPFDMMKRDVKTGLKCKLLLRQGKWREAEVVWQGLHWKELPVQLSLRKEILSQKIADVMTAPADLKEALRELESIGEPLQLPLVGPKEE